MSAISTYVAELALGIKSVNHYSKHLILKSAMESLFGSEAWYALKETNHIPTWRKYSQKTLKAILRSILDTIEIHDEAWLLGITECVDRGFYAIGKDKTIEDIVSSLAGTLVQLSFLQIGMIPNRKGTDHKYPLRPRAWNLSAHRSVVYLQTKEQSEKAFWNNYQPSVGVQRRMELRAEYIESKSELSFLEWCKKHLEDGSTKNA